MKAGFTLTELLVVIGIIGILAAALVPSLIEVNGQAAQAAEQANLRWHHDALKTYRNRHGHLPTETGAAFVLASWKHGIVQHTEENARRYFTPGRPSMSTPQIRAIGVENLWPDEISSGDTDYAGPAAIAREDGNTPLMATDNAGLQPTFLDGSVHVLMGGGAIRSYYPMPDFEEHGFEDGSKRPMPVGPDSPHPVLRLLKEN